MKVTALPYKLASFQGTMVTLVVEGDAHAVVALRNHVSYIHAKVWSREEFEQDYLPTELTADQLAKVLSQFKGYAGSVGITPEAAVYLRHLIDFSPAELRDGLIKGLDTQARIKKEAARMEQTDKTPGSGKAPRKLGGAAAAAVKKKQERLAAEAKKLAGEVSNDQAQLEEAGAADVTVAPTKGGRKPKEKKGETAPKTDGPTVKKTTPSPDQAKRILKGSARKDSQVSADSTFDPSKLKNAEGEYKSASAMFKGLLFEGKLTDEAIAKAVDKKFGLGEQKAKDYVKWNRGWFRRQGVEIAEPKK